MVTTLIVHAGSVAADAAVTRTGGVPLVPAGFSWPDCRACGGPMQFLAQVMLGDLGQEGRQGVLSVFMCQNDPGLCEEWVLAAVQGERRWRGGVFAGGRGFRGGSGCGLVACDDTVSVSVKGRPSPLPFREDRGGP